MLSVGGKTNSCSRPVCEQENEQLQSCCLWAVTYLVEIWSCYLPGAWWRFGPVTYLVEIWSCYLPGGDLELLLTWWRFGAVTHLVEICRL